MKERIREILKQKLFIAKSCGLQVIMGRDQASAEIEKLLPQWIPVSERLPKLGERVVTTNGEWTRTETFQTVYGRTDYGYTPQEDWFDEDSWSAHEVIAWMPESELLKLLPERK